MDIEQQEEFKQVAKEYLDAARQSGKMETSGLIQEILKKLSLVLTN